MPVLIAGSVAAGGMADTLARLVPFVDTFPPQNVRHHFVGQDDERGIYAKELLIPAGWTLGSHEHGYDHLSILASGVARLTMGGKTETAIGPRAIVVPKGARHELYAITPVTWYCIHPTDETDADKVDHAILSQGAV